MVDIHFMAMSVEAKLVGKSCEETESKWFNIPKSYFESLWLKDFILSFDSDWDILLTNRSDGFSEIF